MNKITINGITITGGGSINIANGRIIVDGRDVTPNAKTINIVVNGNIEKLSADVVNSVEINGSVMGDVKTGSGDVQCGDVRGSVSTGSGDVRCGSIGGSVKTGSGDINHK